MWYYYNNRDVIATVGSLKIRKMEFQQEMSYRGGVEINELNKKALLNEMIEQKLLLNQAYALGLDKSPDFKRECEFLLMGKVRKRFIENPIEDIKLDKKDFIAYYSKHKQEYKTVEKKRFAILFYSKENNPTKDEQEEAVKRLTHIINLNDKGTLPKPKEGFGAYAVDYSEHQVSRYQGGMIGWFKKSDKSIWREKVIEAGFKLKSVGDISSIIETDKGFYLVRLAGEKPSEYLPFEKVKHQIRYRLINEKQKEIKEKFKKYLLQSFKISVDTDKLNGIKKKSKDNNNSIDTLPFKTTK